MTLTIEKVFGNYFDDKSINNPRLGNFGKNTLGRFKAMNKTGEYTPIIDIIESPLTIFMNESGEISLVEAQRRGLTITTDMVIDNLHDTMNEKYIEIAYKLGGEKVTAMLEFYPHGVSEYGQATKEKMPIITDRLFKAADLHKAALGKDLSDLLKSFEDLWKNARESQTNKKTEEGTDRTSRNKSRVDLELALTKAVHHIGEKFPGDVEMGKNFFEFHLLYNATNSAKDATTPVV